MAWTTPVTRATGDKMTDSIWNLQLVDNLQYLYDAYKSYACVADEKASGTNGGAMTNGAWRTRDLTIERNDSGGILTLAANQITLVAGVFRCLISVPGFYIDANQARLRNITAGATTLVGSSELSGSAAGYAGSRSIIAGQFTITAPTVFEIQHRCQTTQVNTAAMGQANSFGEVEVYTIAEFWKIG